ncbi:MAG: chemotaxis protein CheC [Ignavibacteriae bacterium]|nr:MAG: chemotaxis protein CheC [Ignavibacteriota bacterium]
MENKIDILKETLNIGVGRAAGILSDMLKKPIKLNVPEILILDINRLNSFYSQVFNEKLSLIKLEFNGPINGNSCLIFPTQSAKKLVKILMDELDENDNNMEIDMLEEGTLTEVGNILLNGIMGSIANLMEDHLDYTVPHYRVDSILNIINESLKPINDNVILAKTKFDIESLEISGDVLLLLEGPGLDKLTSYLSK